ncbi:MAG: hypothetical protein VR78_13895 [Hoeflea sp. BRH_c9]|nr:MAG: hypothetical protein VR78_13895 [Hoeflea sp. BRH_c9]
MRLRIIADDLTGALDAAAPFATPDDPVRLVLDPVGPTADKLTFSSESRDLDQVAAMARVAAAHAALKGEGCAPTLWFKKVDSVLRGHPLAEALALARAGGFDRCVFAPAFPQMGRITKDGRQLVKTRSGGWRQTGPDDLRRAFAALIPEHAPGLDLVVINAETEDDLRTAVQRWQGQPGVLWAGSRGLAQALAAPFAPLSRVSIGLIVLGTNHPVTRAQARMLKGQVSAVPDVGAFAPCTATPQLIDPVPNCQTGAQTGAALAAVLGRLMPPVDGSALLVTGGDTLTILLAETGADALDCVGEIGPGLPLSRIIGGRMAGTAIISKSGGFGGPNLLRDLLLLP